MIVIYIYIYFNNCFSTGLAIKKLGIEHNFCYVSKDQFNSNTRSNMDNVELSLF